LAVLSEIAGHFGYSGNNLFDPRNNGNFYVNKDISNSVVQHIASYSAHDGTTLTAAKIEHIGVLAKNLAIKSSILFTGTTQVKS